MQGFRRKYNGMQIDQFPPRVFINVLMLQPLKLLIKCDIKKTWDREYFPATVWRVPIG